MNKHTLIIPFLLVSLNLHSADGKWKNVLSGMLNKCLPNSLDRRNVDSLKSKIAKLSDKNLYKKIKASVSTLEDKNINFDQLSEISNVERRKNLSVAELEFHRDTRDLNLYIEEYLKRKNIPYTKKYFGNHLDETLADDIVAYDYFTLDRPITAKEAPELKPLLDRMPEDSTFLSALQLAKDANVENPMYHLSKRYNNHSEVPVDEALKALHLNADDIHWINDIEDAFRNQYERLRTVNIPHADEMEDALTDAARSLLYHYMPASFENYSKNIAKLPDADIDKMIKKIKELHEARQNSGRVSANHVDYLSFNHLFMENLENITLQEFLRRQKISSNLVDPDMLKGGNLRAGDRISPNELALKKTAIHITDFGGNTDVQRYIKRVAKVTQPDHIVIEPDELIKLYASAALSTIKSPVNNKRFSYVNIGINQIDDYAKPKTIPHSLKHEFKHMFQEALRKHNTDSIYHPQVHAVGKSDLSSIVSYQRYVSFEELNTHAYNPLDQFKKIQKELKERPKAKYLLDLGSTLQSTAILTSDLDKAASEVVQTLQKMNRSNIDTYIDDDLINDKLEFTYLQFTTLGDHHHQVPLVGQLRDQAIKIKELAAQAKNPDISDRYRKELLDRQYGAKNKLRKLLLNKYEEIKKRSLEVSSRALKARETIQRIGPSVLDGQLSQKEFNELKDAIYRISYAAREGLEIEAYSKARNIRNDIKERIDILR